MSSRRYQVEYAPLAVENLRAVPRTVASQIVRKSHAWNKDYKDYMATSSNYAKPTSAIGYAWVTTGFCSMSKVIQS